MESNGGRKLDMDQLNAALNAKGADAECPVCHQANWGTSSALGVVPVTEGTGPLIDPTKGFEAYAMVCQNCGFVRLHNARVLIGK